MKTENTLLIIDMQNDFCSEAGALYVPGARSDVANLSRFIHQNLTAIDSIILTQDNHHVMDIAHPYFWHDKNGLQPAPFTGITAADVLAGIWTPVPGEETVLFYLKELEIQGEFPHTIWPEHCIWGSWGAAIDSQIQDAVNSWARQGNFFNLVTKGLNPFTEHFGALRANIIMENDDSTAWNLELINKLSHTENIYIAGEARSHCVANTVKQVLDRPEINAHLYILEDCMSNVPGFESISDSIYEEAVRQGATLIASNHLI